MSCSTLPTRSLRICMLEMAILKLGSATRVCEQGDTQSSLSSQARRRAVVPVYVRVLVIQWCGAHHLPGASTRCSRCECI